MTTFPSGSRAEMLPAVPSVSPLRSMSLAAASTCRLMFSTSLTVEDLRVHDVHGSLAGQQAGEVVGDETGVVGLGVVGGPTDVRRQHHVGHPDQGVIDGEMLADEVVEAGGRHLARPQGCDERVGIVQL